MEAHERYSDTVVRSLPSSRRANEGDVHVRFPPPWRRGIAERLQLIKICFFLSSHLLHDLSCSANGCSDQINKYLRHCLWRKYGYEDDGRALIAWNLVCQPKAMDD